jgi:hypothetical protein
MCHLKEAPLIRVTGYLATEQSRLTRATDVRGCKTTRRHTKHRQIRQLVAYRDRLGIRSEDPIPKSQQPAALVDLLGHHGGVDGRLVEAKQIEAEVGHEVLDK